MSKLKIVAISDCHNKYHKLIIPECDILISAGDYSFQGNRKEVKDFHEWFNKQPAKHKISVQGNHELYVEKYFNEMKQVAEEACPGVHFIDEGLVEVEGLKIWCSAITPFFCDWAWNRHSYEIKKHWDKIPDDVDIVATHGPCYGILDQTTYADGTPKSNPLGCPYLAVRIKELKPDIHLCGHIHSGFGEKHIDGTSYYNVSICDELYTPSNPITIIEYEKE